MIFQFIQLDNHIKAIKQIAKSIDEDVTQNN